MKFSAFLLAFLAIVLIWAPVIRADDEDGDADLAESAAKCLLSSINYQSLSCDKFEFVSLQNYSVEGTNDPSGDEFDMNMTFTASLLGHLQKIVYSTTYNMEFDTCDSDSTSFEFVNRRQLFKILSKMDVPEKKEKIDQLLEETVRIYNQEHNRSYTLKSVDSIDLVQNRWGNDKFLRYELVLFLKNATNDGSPFYFYVDAYYPCREFRVVQSTELKTHQCVETNNRHVTNRSNTEGVVEEIANWALGYLNKHNKTAKFPLVWDATAKHHYEKYNTEKHSEYYGNVVVLSLHTTRNGVVEYHGVHVLAEKHRNCYALVKEYPGIKWPNS